MEVKLSYGGFASIKIKRIDKVIEITIPQFAKGFLEKIPENNEITVSLSSILGGISEWLKKAEKK